MLLSVACQGGTCCSIGFYFGVQCNLVNKGLKLHPLHQAWILLLMLVTDSCGCRNADEDVEPLPARLVQEVARQAMDAAEAARDPARMGEEG